MIRGEGWRRSGESLGAQRGVDCLMKVDDALCKDKSVYLNVKV